MHDVSEQNKKKNLKCMSVCIGNDGGFKVLKLLNWKFIQLYYKLHYTFKKFLNSWDFLGVL